MIVSNNESQTSGIGTTEDRFVKVFLERIWGQRTPLIWRGRLNGHSMHILGIAIVKEKLSNKRANQVQWLGWLAKTKGVSEIPQGPSNTDKKNSALLLSCICKNLDKRLKKSAGGGVTDCLKVKRLLHTIPSAEHSQMACSGSSGRL